MKKANAFIFIFFYLLMSKLVFAASVEIEGKEIQCKPKGYETYRCQDGAKIIIATKSEETGTWVSFSKDSNGVILEKPISKLVDEKVIFQSNISIPPYEDTKYNRKIAAYDAYASLKYKDDDFAKELAADGKKYSDAFNDIIPELKIILNESGDSYQCTKGATRPLTLTQNKFQDTYKVKLTCPYYSCVGKDPLEKVLMLLPKPGNTFRAPSTLVMKNGQAKFFEGGFKLTDGSALTVANFPKGYNAKKEKVDINSPSAGVDQDLLIPSKYDNNKGAYKYLMDLAKKNFDDEGLMDLCSGPAVKVLDAERKKIAESMQAYLSEAEIVEYLKVIDGSIHSYYVDKKKSEKLGCSYQNKVVDSSVLGQYEYLKEISTVKSSGKFLKPDEVQDLFKKAKNMKDIPFGYKYDGCYARAHIMSKRFEEMGISTQKVWIRGKLFVPGTDIEWNYHVAPIVEVKEKSGKIVNYVIDPSLTSKAVPIDEWVAAMGKKTTGPVMKTTYPFPGNALDFQRTVVAISPADVYGPLDIQNMTAKDKIDVSMDVLREFSEVLASQGNGQ